MKTFSHTRAPRIIFLVFVLAGLIVPTNAYSQQLDSAQGSAVTVAVQTFEHVTNETTEEWIGHGITETLVSALDTVDGVRTIRSDLTNTELTDVEALEKLDAAWIVRGTFERNDNQIRIVSTLIDSRTAANVMSALIDGAISDLFQLQDQLVHILQDELTIERTRAKATLQRANGNIATTSSVTSDRPAAEAQHFQAHDEVPAPDFDSPRTQPSEQYRVEPVQVNEGPNIDGSLSEPVWSQAAVIDNFVQQEPSEGNPATERTVVRLLYDETNVYIGVEAFDSTPDGIVATEMRRDSRRILDEDNFQIIFDTFQDRRSGYMFVTSPLGAKLEQQITEEGEGGWRGSNTANINVNWDGVWDVKTTQTSNGWVAEIAIPMVTLRFPKVDQQSWGANFMRNIRRKNEQVFWAPITKEYQITRVSLAGTMAGMRSVNQGMDLRVTPYVLASGTQQRSGERLVTTGAGDIGLDVKYGVTSGLNLDLTLNTDFAQVEVDEQQVNLTRFPLFFPEKRDFFLENSGMFDVGSGSSGWGRSATLFFTRRIGLSESGQPIPIIGGARLTGKTGRNNIAALNITTQENFGRAGENFFVGRYSRDIFSRSKIGGIVINKETLGGSDYNRTVAADAALALHPNFVVNSFVAKTESPGVSTGNMAGFISGKWLSPSWNIYGQYIDLQDNFNAEVGFVPRIGIRESEFHIEWDPRPDRWNIRQLDPMWDITYTTDQHNRLLSRRVHYMVGVYFEDGSSGWVYYNDLFEQLDFPFFIHENVTIPSGTYRFGEWVYMYSTDQSKRLYGRVNYSPQTFFGGTRTDFRVTAGVRATNSIAFEARFSRSDVSLPGGAFIADLASLTADFAFSPQLTLRTLSQYNSVTHEISNSVRFNWIYKPGSDLYITYDELRTDMDPQFAGIRRASPWVRNRQLAIKLTYLLTR